MGSDVMWDLGGATVMWVAGPGFELLLPSDEATAAVLQASPWLAPRFVTDDWSLRIGSSATVVDAAGQTLVLDPFLAFDDPDRRDARMAELAEAEVEPDDVDVVILSHIDGWGVSFTADWSPTFPNARYLLPAAELETMRSGTHPQADDAAGLAALEALLAAGRLELVDATDGPVTVVPGVTVEDAPGHNPGQLVTWVHGADQSAVVVGHLFLHPAQIAAPDVDNGDLDPVVLAQTRRALLARCVEERAILVGPLFAFPGGGSIDGVDDAWALR